MLIYNYMNNNFTIKNTRDQKKKMDKKSSKLKKEKVGDGNIYDRQLFTNSYKQYEDITENRIKQSKNPKKTRVIPKYYNINKFFNDRQDKIKEQSALNHASNEHFSEDSVFSDNQSMSTTSMGSGGSLDMTNLNQFIDKGNRLVDNRKHERKFVKKVPDNNNFMHQFDEI